MRNKKYHIYLTEEERKLAIKALIDERNALIVAGRYTDAIDDLLVRILSRKPKNMLVVAV
ncbi:MAG: hypothetical protein IJ091_00920 [Oscillospiraceae bacterium]|nr:hypothetical protein [Oscillospiraceae bacterium]